jgi:hypothetical protein
MELKLENVRLAFPVLFEPKTMNAGEKPAWSAVFILPNDHPQLARVRQAVEQVGSDKFGSQWAKIRPGLQSAGKLCFRDGADKSAYDGFEDCWYLSTRAYARPGVYDRDTSVLTERDGVVYAGCYVNALVDIYAQDNAYGRRINATLRGVQFARDGDAFSGGRPARASDFTSLAVENDLF